MNGTTPLPKVKVFVNKMHIICTGLFCEPQKNGKLSLRLTRKRARKGAKGALITRSACLPLVITNDQVQDGEHC
jgi:hypothetical protein